MRTVTEIETSVPAFLGKLWKLVEDPETDDLICWSLNGRSFFIRNPAQFARDLLPHYYKHNNMASFVRQLNMYGFHKKVSVELGGLKCDRDEMEFAHQYFIKDHPYLLEHIKRKIATSKLPDSQPPVKNDMMNQVLDEVRTMRGRQEHLDTRLGSMKRENEALWRELAMLRRKHLKQQEIVNKLIHFLVTLVQPNRTGGLSVKRRYPLMIDAHQRHKQAKMSKAGTSPTGPVIHELHESDHSPDSDSEYIVAEMLENHQYPSVQSPKSVNSLLHNGVPEPEQLIEQSLAAGNDSDECLEPQVMNLKRKKAVKPRRKRKHKMPMKLLIPSTENGGKPREETVMLDIDTTAEEEEEEQQEIKVDHSKMTIASSPTPIILAKSKPAKPPAKLPVPMKTVRSSKLAALAANINKMNEQDDSDEAEEESRVDTPDINLDDILIVPDMDQDIYGSAGNSGETSQASLTNQQINVNNEDDDRAGSSSGSNDLSLSCLGSSSGTTDAEYREEIGSHVNSMQTELERIREKCENGSFDASAFLGLFEDPMFEMMSTELDPMLRDRNSEDQSSAGNELMAYNSSQNLLDIDNDLFQAVENSPPPADVISSLTECYNPDQFDLEDSKALLVDSLLSDANANKSGIS